MFNRVSGYGLPDDLLSLRPADRIASLPLEIQELVQQQSVTAAPLSAAAESDWPVSVFVPERYEQNYAYPLIIWFHEDGQNEGQVESVLSTVSSQNYCGLGIQGNLTSSGGGSRCGWNTNALEYGNVPLTDLLCVTVRRLRRAFHIHSERIFVAGSGRGADVALHQLAQTPDWYAGAVLFDPECPRHITEGISTASLRGKSLLWTVARTASSEVLACNVQAVQLIRLAGAELDVRLTELPIDPESGEMRFVDHWLLSRMGSEVLV